MKEKRREEKKRGEEEEERREERRRERSKGSVGNCMFNTLPLMRRLAFDFFFMMISSR